MDLELTGKRALVMGSTRGMGRAIAEGLAAEGARVAVCGRKATDAEAAAAEIGAGAAGYGLDLADGESVSALIKAVQGEFGGLDIIVCNSGGPPPGPIAEVTPETWMRQFEIMFVNQSRIVNEFLPAMRDAGWGRILTISSSGVVQPIDNLGISNALRASRLGWAKTLATEIAGDGVTVNTVLPGRIHTSRVDELDDSAAQRLGKTRDEVATASKAAIPAKRYGTVEEFADVALFLLSARAGYVTGSVIRVDGGMIRGV